MSGADVVVIILAVALLLTTVLLVRGGTHPWRAIGVATLTSALCYTVGGDGVEGSNGPSPGTVLGSVVGVAALVAMILALVPRDRKRPPSRVPFGLALAGIVVGSIGMILSHLP